MQPVLVLVLLGLSQTKRHVTLQAAMELLVLCYYIHQFINSVLFSVHGDA